MAGLIWRYKLEHVQTHEQRLEWAGERIWDLAEGKLDQEDTQFVIGQLQGWADVAADNERREYRALAGQMQDLYRAMFED